MFIIDPPIKNAFMAPKIKYITRSSPKTYFATPVSYVLKLSEIIPTFLIWQGKKQKDFRSMGVLVDFQLKENCGNAFD